MKKEGRKGGRTEGGREAVEDVGRNGRDGLRFNPFGKEESRK